MKKIKMLRALILAIGITVLSSNVALAQVNDDNNATEQIIQIAVVDEDLIEKQNEIDNIIFNEKSEELDKQDFTVVSTRIVDTYIEVGIEPYSEEKAEYLYNILGRDKVKVVEGSLAHTVVEDNNSGDSEFSITNTEDDEQEPEFHTTNDVAEDAEQGISFMIPLLILVVLAIGVFAFLSTRKKTNGRR